MDVLDELQMSYTVRRLQEELFDKMTDEELQQQLKYIKEKGLEGGIEEFWTNQEIEKRRSDGETIL